MVDGGMVSLSVVSKAGPDVVARVVDPGLILSRANLTFQRDGRIVRARNAMLPVLSSKVTHEAPCHGRWPFAYTDANTVNCTVHFAARP